MDSGATGALMGVPSRPISSELRVKSSNGSDARQEDLWERTIASEKIVAARSSASSGGSPIAALRDMISGAGGNREHAGAAVEAEDLQGGSRKPDNVHGHNHEGRGSEAVLLSALLAAAEAAPLAGSFVQLTPASIEGATAGYPHQIGVSQSADVLSWGGRGPIAGALRSLDLAEDALVDRVLTVKSMETHRAVGTVATSLPAIDASGAALAAGKPDGAISGAMQRAAQPSGSDLATHMGVAAEPVATDPDLAQPSSTEPGRSGRKSHRADASSGRPLTGELTATLDELGGRSRAHLRTMVIGVEAGSGTRTDGASASPVMADHDRPQQPTQVLAQIGGAILREFRQLVDDGHGAFAASGGSFETAAGWRSEATVVKQLVIELEPADLGRVSVRIRLNEGELDLMFRTDLASTSVLIAEQIGDLGQRLGSAGYAVDAIRVAAAGDRSEVPGDVPSQREPQSQWPGREAGSGDTGSRRNQTHGDQQRNNQSFGGTGSVADIDRHAASPTVRNDGVFV